MTVEELRDELNSLIIRGMGDCVVMDECTDELYNEEINKVYWAADRIWITHKQKGGEK